MFYHHVLAWKACYTYFSAVLFKPTSRTQKIVSISSPSSEGGGIDAKLEFVVSIVSISSPSSEGGGQWKLILLGIGLVFPISPH
jgi:hypothetical protein